MRWVEAVWQRFERASLGTRLSWVAAAAGAAHASVLRGGFVWLDHAHIQKKLAIAPPRDWLSLFRSPFAGTGFYRPLTALSLSLDALAGSPFVYHLTTLLWHVAASVLVVLAAQALGLSRRSATLGGLLFAVHPLGSLVAGAVAFRSESMITVALLALVLAHMRGRPVLAGLALLGGGLCKETALVLGPAFVAALEIASPNRAPRPTRTRVLGAELCALLLLVALRVAFAPEWLARHPELSAGEALGTRLATLSKSTAAFVLPLERSICDAFPITTLGHPFALLGGALALGVVALALTAPPLGRLLALALLPSLQIWPTLRFWSPHYLYVPMAFAVLLVAERIERRGREAFAVLLLACVALGLASWTDGRRYRDDETLFGPEVAREPACREGQFYLAESHRQRGEWTAAAERYELALGSPASMLAFLDLDAALQNLGLVRRELGQLDAARAAFTGALAVTRSETTRRQVTHNLAVVELQSRRPERAVELLAAEANRSDPMPASLLVYAGALRALGRHAEAEAAQARARARSAPGSP